MAKIVIRTHGPAVSEEVLQKAVLSALKRLKEAGVAELEAFVYKGQDGDYRDIKLTPEILTLIGEHQP